MDAPVSSHNDSCRAIWLALSSHPLPLIVARGPGTFSERQPHLLQAEMVPRGQQAQRGPLCSRSWGPQQGRGLDKGPRAKASRQWEGSEPLAQRGGVRASRGREEARPKEGAGARWSLQEVNPSPQGQLKGLGDMQSLMSSQPQTLIEDDRQSSGREHVR